MNIITLKYGESAVELLSPLIMLIPDHPIKASFAMTLHHPANTDIKSMPELAATVITQIAKNPSINRAKNTRLVRDNIPVIYGCTYTHTPSSQKNDLANANDTRSIICLDFDEDGQDINSILSLLSQYTYFGWTTKSHSVENPRFTVIIPLSSEIDQSTWRKNRIALGLAIKGLGLIVDGSCTEYIQARYMPTPEISDVTYFANAGSAIDYHSLIASVPQEDIDAIVNKSKAHEQAIIDAAMGLCVQHATSENGKYDALIRKGLTVSSVDRLAMRVVSIYKGKLKRNDRYGWAQAFCYFDRLDLFDNFDRIVRKEDTKTSSTDLLSAACTNPHPNTLFKHFSIKELRALDIVPTGEEDVLCEYAWDRLFDKDDYLSVAHYGNKQSVLMVADVNSGKNYCWQNYNEMNPGRVIVLSPLTAIVRQSDNSDDANTVDIANGNFKWSLVYDKAEKLIDLFAAGTSTIKPEEITLVIDEAHNLATATYRAKALTAVMDLIKSQKWKKVIYQSATVDVPSFRATIDVDEVIRFKKKVQRKINYHHVPQITVPDPDVAEGYRKIPNTIPSMNIIIDAVSKGKKVIVLNNDKDGNVSIKNTLSKHAGTKITVELVDSDRIKKYGTTANDMANNQDFCMGDIDVLIGTYSLVEGINIKDDITDAVAVVIGPEDVSYVVQLAGRFRKANTINLYHIFGNGTTTGSIADMVRMINYNNKIKCAYADAVIAASRAIGDAETIIRDIDGLSLDVSSSGAHLESSLYKIGKVINIGVTINDITLDANILQSQQDYINARKAVFHSDSEKRNIICKLYGMTPTEYTDVPEIITEDHWRDIRGSVTEVRKTAYNKMLATINTAYSDTDGAAHAMKDITSQKDGVYADIIDAICKTKEAYDIFVTNITQEPKRLLNKLNEADAARNTKSTSTTYHTTVRELLKIKITDTGTSDLTADDIRDSINSAIGIHAKDHKISIAQSIKIIGKLDGKCNIIDVVDAAGKVVGEAAEYVGRLGPFLQSYAVIVQETGCKTKPDSTGKRHKLYSVDIQ